MLPRQRRRRRRHTFRSPEGKTHGQVHAVFRELEGDVALPMPRDAPVTMATTMSVLFLGSGFELGPKGRCDVLWKTEVEVLD